MNADFLKFMSRETLGCHIFCGKRYLTIEYKYTKNSYKYRNGGWWTFDLGQPLAECCTPLSYNKSRPKNR